MNEQSRYKQDKTITRQSINIKRHIFNVIGDTEKFEERDLNIGGDLVIQRRTLLLAALVPSTQMRQSIKRSYVARANVFATDCDDAMVKIYSLEFFLIDAANRAAVILLDAAVVLADV
ncbi:hypothetical protein Tco_0065240 [Tanacetum coccineum]